MKKFILVFSLLISSLTFAENQGIVYPYVYNIGYGVQVQVWNHTEENINCSGWVYMNMESGKQQSEYYFDMVWARQHSFRMIYSRNIGERIRYVSHSIFCR